MEKENQRKIAQITCRSCQHQFKMYVPETPCVVKVKCPACDTAMAINFANPKPIQMAEQGNVPAKQQAEQSTEITKPQVTRHLSVSAGRGQLVQLRGLLHKNIVHNLRLGENTIGRYDTHTPSLIMIKGDSSVSRRSISLNVRLQGEDYVYSIKVLKSANPVLVQGHRLQNGEETYLDFGDIIQLGKTKFRFEKIK